MTGVCKLVLTRSIFYPECCKFAKILPKFDSPFMQAFSVPLNTFCEQFFNFMARHFASTQHGKQSSGVSCEVRMARLRTACSCVSVCVCVRARVFAAIYRYIFVHVVRFLNVKSARIDNLFKHIIFDIGYLNLPHVHIGMCPYEVNLGLRCPSGDDT